MLRWMIASLFVSNLSFALEIPTTVPKEEIEVTCYDVNDVLKFTYTYRLATNVATEVITDRQNKLVGMASTSRENMMHLYRDSYQTMFSIGNAADVFVGVKIIHEGQERVEWNYAQHLCRTSDGPIGEACRATRRCYLTKWK